MRRFPTFIALLGAAMIAAAAIQASAQDGPPAGPGGEGAGGPPPRREGAGGPGGAGGRGGPAGGFHLIQRFALEKLNLTEDQQKQVAELEKETKAKLYKILTPEQQKILETARARRVQVKAALAAKMDRVGRVDPVPAGADPADKVEADRVVPAALRLAEIRPGRSVLLPSNLFVVIAVRALSPVTARRMHPIYQYS